MVVKKKMLGLSLLSFFIFNPFVYGTSCQALTLAPRTSTIPSHYIQHFCLLSMCVSDLIPKIDHSYSSSMNHLKNESVVKKIKNQNFKLKKNEKRNRSKSSSKLSSSFNKEFQKNEKNLIELLTSENVSDNRLGREALCRLLMAELHWKLKHGRRQFLMPKIDQFLKNVHGKSEEHFEKFFDWFLSEVQMDKKFFKNGKSRLKHKDRPWRESLSEKESYIRHLDSEDFLEDLGEDDRDDLDQNEIFISNEESYDEFSDMKDQSKIDEDFLELDFEDYSSEDQIYGLNDLSFDLEIDDSEDLSFESQIKPILRDKYKEQKKIGMIEKEKDLELEEFEFLADKQLTRKKYR